MNDPRDQLVYERGLAFFGRMAAGVSHEMKNVLSILNELGGLIDDLLYTAQKGGQIAPEQLTRIAEGIGKQVRRGDSHARNLHHFGHNVDSMDAKTPLQQAIDEIVALCQRIARLQRVTLAAEASEGATVEIDKVFVWQHMVYECVCLALENVQEDDVVAVRVARRDAAASLEIVSPRGMRAEAVNTRMPVLEALAAELGTRIEVVGDESGEQALAVAVPE
jgi:C4-dicarboxylate-specific signal transduction histidine kinase